MPIVGFNFDKIDVERKRVITGPINVKSDVSIKQVAKETVTTSNLKKDELLKFTFEFKAEYEPKIGAILLGGYMLFSEKPATLQKILETWNKDKKIEPTLMAQLVNIALFRCSIKALTLAQDVSLPPHLKLPSVSPKIDVKDYIG